MTTFICERVGCAKEMRPKIHIIRIGTTLMDVCEDCMLEINDAITDVVSRPPVDVLSVRENELTNSEEFKTLKEEYLAIKPK